VTHHAIDQECLIHNQWKKLLYVIFFEGGVVREKDATVFF